ECGAEPHVRKMDEPTTRVFALLDALGIPYASYTHPPVFTAEQAAEHWSAIPAYAVKNLFLRNKKGDRHYLAMLGIERQADLRQLARVIGDDRLSFASPERLMTHLGLTPGSVSPFGLINDASHAVRVVIDEDLRRADRLIFHPNVNTASLTISFTDFERFLASRGNPVRWVRL
ncbi:MAG TPA: prolyl-tRNA synthetase associated domain-containing protein, partial [Vicinamibacterales bacterium]|nr:prolyl-tRNA synthetase associated domain-containing protein [Vicinamibacterales bacterium]